MYSPWNWPKSILRHYQFHENDEISQSQYLNKKKTMWFYLAFLNKMLEIFYCQL